MKLALINLLLMWMVTGAASAGAQPGSNATPPIVRIVARDYTFETSPRWPAGVVRLRLVNRGSEPHYAILYRLDGARTATDFFTWRASRAPSPDWLTPASGPAPVAPGDSTDLTLHLPAGHYIVLCGYPGKEGLQHVDNGMFRVFDAQPARGRSTRVARYPAVQRTLRLTDSRMSLDQPIPAGWRAIGIENSGSNPEQALVVRLPEGVEVTSEQRWFDDGFRSPRPGVPAGGALLVVPGERYVVTRYFAPGRYAVLSHLTGKWRSLLFIVR